MLHPVGLVWLCTVDNHQQNVVLERKLLTAGHYCIPGTGEVQALCPVELRVWKQHEMMSSHQGPLAVFYPRENFESRIGFVSNAIVMELDCKAIMGNLIKSLAIIQQHCINLLPSVQSNCNVLYSSDELSLTRSLLPEAMLVIAQNLIVLRKLHKRVKIAFQIPFSGVKLQIASFFQPRTLSQGKRPACDYCRRIRETSRFYAIANNRESTYSHP